MDVRMDILYEGVRSCKDKTERRHAEERSSSYDVQSPTCGAASSALPVNAIPSAALM